MEIAELHIVSSGDVVVATVAGEIDMSNSGDIRASLERRLSNAHVGLVIDLTGATYIDSAGVQLLYRLAKQLESRGQRLSLVVPPGSMAEQTLRYAAVLSTLTILPTLHDARAAVG
jgi:anti-anti-sigma factor